MLAQYCTNWMLPKLGPILVSFLFITIPSGCCRILVPSLCHACSLLYQLDVAGCWSLPCVMLAHYCTNWMLPDLGPFLVSCLLITVPTGCCRMLVPSLCHAYSLLQELDAVGCWSLPCVILADFYRNWILPDFDPILHPYMLFPPHLIVMLLILSCCFLAAVAPRKFLLFFFLVTFK